MFKLSMKNGYYDRQNGLDRLSARCQESVRTLSADCQRSGEKPHADTKKYIRSRNLGQNTPENGSNMAVWYKRVVAVSAMTLAVLFAIYGSKCGFTVRQQISFAVAAVGINIYVDIFGLLNRVLAPQSKLITGIWICTWAWPLNSNDLVRPIAVSLSITLFGLLLTYIMNEKWLAAYNWLMLPEIEAVLIADSDSESALAWQSYGMRGCRTMFHCLGEVPSDNELNSTCKPVFQFAWAKQQKKVLEAEARVESIRSKMERYDCERADLIDRAEYAENCVKNIQSEFESWKRDNESNQGILLAARETEAKLKQENEQLREEIAELRSDNEKLTKANGELTKANKELTETNEAVMNPAEIITDADDDTDDHPQITVEMRLEAARMIASGKKLKEVFENSDLPMDDIKAINKAITLFREGGSVRSVASETGLSKFNAEHIRHIALDSRHGLKVVNG